MAENENLPDWLKQLRDQQMGPAPSQAAEPVAEPAEEGAPAVEAAGGANEFDALRERASAEPMVEEEPPRVIPIISDLSPFQRFVLALMVFLNVSVLGCLALMVLGKITLVR
jgi:Spy/CpxP family protein refolding chaperone